LITRWGKGVRFSQRVIETQGSVGLELDRDDEIAAAVALPTDTEVLILTSSGRAMRRETAPFAARSRPGGAGKTLIQARDVLAVIPCASEADLLFLSSSGILTSAPVADLSLEQRASRGTPLLDLSRDPALAVVWVPSLAGL
jgi:DNA gyrase/topoisomerase IV subunit A